jgi:uncharacterized membrane protein
MFIKLFLIAFPVFVGIDMIWIGWLAKIFYAKQIGKLMTSKVNLGAAVLFYILYIAGVVFFVISPAYEKNSWTFALLAGTFFGAVAYATYDLTNLATIKNWPLILTFVDLIWGSFLTALVSIITFLLSKRIGL